ncbi:MAG: hypothetical protein WC851_04635 [Candidatus Shapirobacteria bacterium]|jgi:hypothetical protein
MATQIFSRKTAQRLSWGILSVVLWYEYFRLLDISMRWNYNNPLIWPTWLLGLVSLEMAIMYDHPWAIKLRTFMDKPCHIVAALYLSLSGFLLFMIKIGWDGCLYKGESVLTCIKTLTSTWDYFPVTHPSFEMVLISFRGFGGQDEVLGAFATLLMSTGLVWILNVTAPKDVPYKRKLLSTMSLLSSALGAYYFLYTVTQNVNSWPGIVLFVFLSALFLTMDWLYQRANQ